MEEKPEKGKKACDLEEGFSTTALLTFWGFSYSLLGGCPKIRG